MAGIRSKQKAERPDQILDAAFDEFVRTGYGAARLEDIAKRVGITKGTIYFYYGSKENLFKTLVRSLSAPLATEFQEKEWEWSGDIAADIDYIVSRLYRFILENPKFREVLRLLVAEVDRFPEFVDDNFAEFADPIFASLSRRFDLAVADGDIEPTNTYELARFMVAPPMFLNITSLLFGNRKATDTDAFISIHKSVLRNGLLKPKAAGETSA
ncbi:AcrR family transcriptional regulator [Rhodoblastus acidophilus]|uniref:TetR/AcrR family transcriptional regulator n=1 Tax=Rhodoblastus acidophilus TaxID=1074 RepID=UPI002225048F|nr:TetR/AcrR family transcriptional regulator [Rhodoblastus acidophilus]MCW2284190.1 AcrR family transcriptional regulator [Rhodoblastus acidophilus]MCW2333035.1 AcrR family transcriptional regulator [Rhodoblastus acidophilus]